MKPIFKFILLVSSHLFVISIGAQDYDASLFSQLKLRNVGPANMSGRITAIAVANENPNILYVGAASGGVWKSENGGSAWHPVFDDAPTQNIGAIALQPNNPQVIYVGTGEGNARNSMNLGMGMFKSHDGGRTWKHIGLEKTKTIHRILIDPIQPNRIFVGAAGDPFTPNKDRGLYLSEDWGETWKQILYTNDQSGVADMVQDPANPNKIFVAMYEHRRTPYSFTSGGPGSGLYMTVDGGDNWKKLDDSNGLPKGELGRIGIAIAPSNTNRIYAKIEASKNSIYRSGDGGYSWKLINDNPKFANNRPFYFQDLAVDSKDHNRLYNIYQPLSVSYDGGQTFDPEPMIPADETKGIHADFHAFWMNPKDPKHFIIGGDGGIGITRDHGKSWYFAEDIPVAQCYHIGVDDEQPYNVYAGMQDNGNWSGPGYVWKRGGIRTMYWQYLVGGDGFYISPDSGNARHGYGTSQNGDLYRYDKLTGYYQSVKPLQDNTKNRLRFNWNAGFARDPFDKNTLYYGSQFVHRSENQGASWKVISPDLTHNNPDQQKEDYGGLTLDKSGAEYYNSILAIAPSRKDKNIIWIGTDDGLVHLTQNGGKSWSNLTENIVGLPDQSWISRIHASAYDASSAWVVANNYRKGDYNTYLFRTTDFGKSWKRVADQSHIRGYALCFIQDPIQSNLQFLGTEHGLWVSLDDGANWNQIKNGFPSVSTMDLAIQEKEAALIVGTFGRAIWILDDLNVLRTVADKKPEQILSIIPPIPSVQVKGIFINPPGNIWSGFNTTFEGVNRSFRSAPIAYFLNKDSIHQNTTAFIYNSSNELIQTIIHESAAREGLNYIEWKLDEAITRLPNAYTNEESRGIPVVPGIYKIKLQNGTHIDSSSIEILLDPRFENLKDVDIALYELQKKLDIERQIFNKAYRSLEKMDSTTNHILNQIGLLNTTKLEAALSQTNSMKDQIRELKEKGVGSRPARQLGAWQSFQVTPASLVRDAEKLYMSNMKLPATKEEELLQEIRISVSEFTKTVKTFDTNDWDGYKAKMLVQPLYWFQE